MLKVVTVSEAVGRVKSPDGTVKGYVIELIQEARKAGITKFIPKLQLFVANRYLKTRDDRYYEALEHLRFVAALVHCYNDKQLYSHHSYFRDFLRGYGLA